MRASCVIAFDAVLIVHVGHKQSIRILDLECDGKYEWREPESKLDCGKYPAGRMVSSKDNDLHFINAYETGEVHYRIHSSRFIPNDIYIKYTNR